MLTPVRQKVFDYVIKKKKVYATDIVRALGGSTAAANGALRGLCDQKLLERREEPNTASGTRFAYFLSQDYLISQEKSDNDK